MVDRRDVDLIDEGDQRRFFRVFLPADYLQTVDSILEVGLARERSTLYGPRIVPFQYDRVMSSPMSA